MIFSKFKKRRKYTVLNILGLSLGLCLTLMISMLIEYELSYDKFYSKKDKIICVLQKDIKNGNLFDTPYPLPETLKNDFPEIESVATINDFDEGLNFKYHDLNYEDFSGATITRDVLDVFDFNLLLGNADNVLDSPFKVVISKSVSKKVFGSENPVGKEINMYDHTFTITGVFEDMPVNSSFNFDLLFSHKLDKVTYEEADVAWWASGLSTYIIPKEGVDL